MQSQTIYADHDTGVKLCCARIHKLCRDIFVKVYTPKIVNQKAALAKGYRAWPYAWVYAKSLQCIGRLLQRKSDDLAACMEIFLCTFRPSGASLLDQFAEIPLATNCLS